jgi:hypothetical protein
MRILKSTKPIPAWYLKSRKDKGAYDQVVKLWLPGSTTPIDRPDMKLVKRKGVRDGGIARPVAPKQPPGTTALIVPRHVAAERRGEKAPIPRLVIAKR